MPRGWSTAARADAFARTLDAAQVPGRHDEQDEPLVALVTQLRALPVEPAVPAASARAAVLAAARDVLAESATTPTHPPARRPVRRAHRSVRPLVAGALALAIGTTGLGGVALAAHYSGPGGAFYSVKKATERLQLALSGGSADRARARLGFSAARMHELRALASRDASPTDQVRMVSLLQQIRDEMQAASGPLAHGDAADQEKLWNSANSTAAALRSIASALPAALQADLTATLTLVTSIKTSVATLLGLAGVTVPGVSGLLPGLGAASGSAGSGSGKGSTGNGLGPTPAPRTSSAPAGGIGGIIGGIVPTTGPTTTPTARPSTASSSAGGLGGIIGGLLPSNEPTSGPTASPPKTTPPVLPPITISVPPVTIPGGPTISVPPITLPIL